MLNKAFLPLVFAVSFGTTAKADSYLPAVEDIMQVAQTLSLTDLDVHPDDKGSDGTGRLPGGARVEFDLHQNGTLDKIEAHGHQTIPLADLMPILPAQFSAPALTPQSAITQVEFDDDHLEIEGRTSSGREFKGEFTTSGRMLEWKQD